MTIYDELLPISKELLKEFKQGTIKHIKLTAGNGPADDPGAPTEVETDVDAVVKGVSFKYLKDAFATAGDKIITVAPNEEIIISQADYFKIDGERWKIIADISSPGAGTRIVWKYIIRKGG